jgi:hypothetical protein
MAVKARDYISRQDSAVSSHAPRCTLSQTLNSSYDHASSSEPRSVIALQPLQVQRSETHGVPSVEPDSFTLSFGRRSNGVATGCTKLKSCTSRPFFPTKKSRLSATSRLYTG